jgi:uncharacterized membrane protein YphA (DoxX/SURF4 family)
MSQPRSAKDWLFDGLRVVVGGVLFVAGFQKLSSSAQFAEVIANFRILPAQGNQLLAVVLPWCEIAAGLFLVAGIWTRAAGIVGALLFVSFGIAAGSALIRGLDIECGCFGTGAHARVGLTTLAIDLAGLIGTLPAIWRTQAPEVPVRPS